MYVLNHKPKYEQIKLPLRCGLEIRSVPFAFLAKAVHGASQSIKAASGDFYYLAVRKLMRGFLNSIAVEEAKLTYQKRASDYAAVLMEVLPGVYDAIVAIPTSEPAVQAPFVQAPRERWPDLSDLSPFLIRSVSSTDSLPCEQRLEGTAFGPPAEVRMKSQILVIDDMLDTGVSAEASMRAIDRVWQDASCQFTLCCPLWITHD